MIEIHRPTANRLLGALAPDELGRLLPYLEYTAMPLGTVLYESGGTLHHIYFPIDCIVSLLYVLADGSSAEIAIVGKEGLIGIGLFMGERRPPTSRWCRAGATPIAWQGDQSRKSFIASARSMSSS